MMNFEKPIRSYLKQEQWIRDIICEKNPLIMTPGEKRGQILTTVEPTLDMVQIGTNWEVTLFPGYKDGLLDEDWFVEIYEKSTDRKFLFAIYMIS